MKNVTLIAIAVIAMAFTSCGNNASNTNTNTNSDAEKKSNDAPAEVAYEQISIEKYGVTFDILKGMRRTDDPSTSDNGGVWTLVPEDDNDFPIYATVQCSVYESFLGDFDDERIQKDFENEIPEEAEKTLNLEKKEYTYSVGEDLKEFHHVYYKGNQQISILVAYTDRWEPKLGGEVRDHILNSVKF